MTEQEITNRRLTALDYATRIMVSAGITCLGCITKAASQIDAFLEKGTVAEHDGEGGEDDEVTLLDKSGEPVNVIPLDPKKKH